MKSAFLSVFFATMLVTSPIMEVASTTAPPPGPYESAEKSVKSTPSPQNMTSVNSTSTVTVFPALVKLTCSRCGKGCLKAAHKQECFDFQVLR
ncbi:hypothetical protein L2E82_33690 [Cichorium intybus]|uniref:Uncharacterized protein n=1 Tax=Cichorium intybus TaxID=13427 RepID=A0ACB9BL71_CICIN|nr:hypothetical protein L2E82_33690 [Cichorium intybus]